MRNMIFKTLFASILGSLLLAPLANADRQGGGTLMVAMAFDESGINRIPALLKPIEFPGLGAGAVQSLMANEAVRFKSATTGKLTFEYLSSVMQAAEVTVRRRDLAPNHRRLIEALGESKLSGAWVTLEAIEIR